MRFGGSDERACPATRARMRLSTHSEQCPRHAPLAFVSSTTTTRDGPGDIGVLVIEDHAALRAGCRRLLDSEPGFGCIGSLSRPDDRPAGP